jgi:hypothetical protein
VLIQVPSVPASSIIVQLVTYGFLRGRRQTVTATPRFPQKLKQRLAGEESTVAITFPTKAELPTNGEAALGNDADLFLPVDAQQMLRSLEKACGESFSIVDCANGQILRVAHGSLPIDLYSRLTSYEQVARRGRPEIIDEVSPIAVIAVPLLGPNGDCSLVAVAAFVTERVNNQSEVTAAAHEFSVDAEQAFAWAKSQTPWPPQGLLELGAAISERANLQQSAVQLKRQMADISSHLLMTFEEITLLHRLTEHLSISKSVGDICELSVNWLGDVIPAKSVVIWFESFGHLGDQYTMGQGDDGHAVLISHGTCPLPK